MDKRSLALPRSSTSTQRLLASCLASVLFLSIAAQSQTFLIEAEDFNYEGGQHQAAADTMPYYGGAYSGLAATYDVDYNRPDDGSSPVYRNDGRIPMDDNSGDANRGAWNVNVNFKLGWIGEGMWFNYTRSFPAGYYKVYAALSYGDTSVSTLRGSMQRVTSNPSQPGQTLVPLGSFDAPGTGGWGLNALVPMKDSNGKTVLLELNGTQTLRFTAGSGDIDYYKFVKEGPPQITQQPANASVMEGQAATFTLVLASPDAASYQWQSNRVNIAGATTDTYVLPATPLSANQAKYRCIATNPVGQTNSTEATLTVTADNVKPTLVKVQNLGLTNLMVVFSEAVRSPDATVPSQYALDQGITVQSAAFGATPDTIILVTSPMTLGTTCVLVVNGVQDRAVSPNTILANSQKSFLVVDYAPVEIGAPALAGSSTPVAGGFDVVGGGSDIGGASDQFHFDYQLRTGDFDVKVRVESLDPSEPWAKASLMGREQLTLDSPFVASVATPQTVGCFFLQRGTTGASASASGFFPANYPDTWLRLRRVGNIFTGYASLDGQNWQQLGSTTIAMPATIYLGQAVTSRDTTKTTTAKFRDLGSVSGGAIGTFLPDAEPLGPSSRRTGLTISEIMYHPATRADGKILEFVELFNAGPIFEDMSGWRLSGALDYRFPEGTVLPADGFLVVARVPADVQSVYGLTGVLGGYTNVLQNSSGVVRLRNRADAVLLEAAYDGKPPWPAAADGAGHSLVLARPSYGEGSVKAWAASAWVGGSPGHADPFPAGPLRQVVLNEFLAHTDDPQVDYVELFNRSAQAIDVSGCILTDDLSTNAFVIPAGTTLPGRGFLAYDQNELGFALSAAGETIYLFNSNRTAVLDAIRFGPQANGLPTGRYPNGEPDWRVLASPTFKAANAAPWQSEVVINELMYNPVSGNADDEYVELYNRGSAPVSLAGWKFTEGIDFTFPTNAFIAAGGYVVVAKEVSRLLTNYAGLTTQNTFGNFKGSLSGSGERLSLARYEELVSTNKAGALETNVVRVVVNEVDYNTGGRWPTWADGGGSSLELIDPASDNRQPSNWAESDETTKAPYTTVEATGVLDNGNGNYPPDSLQVLTQDGGEYLVDDVEVFKAAGANVVANGTFNTDTSGWVFQGNHSGSSLETNGGTGNSKCLHVRAPGRGDTGMNRIRYNFPNPSAVQPGDTVTLRARVRWLKGHPEFMLRLRGSWLEATARLATPANCGTPGAANSRRVSNAGPSIIEVAHKPVLPAAAQTVLVTARVADPDGVNRAVLYYRIQPNTAFSQVTMRDDGASGDAVAGDGIYSARIPGQGDGALAAFYVLANDNYATPATSRFPSDAPARECLVRWGETQSLGTFGVYRFWISQKTLDSWGVGGGPLNNTWHDATFVYGNSRAVYNFGLRDKGSPWHGGGGDYFGNFPKDDLFMGDTDITLCSPGNGDNDDTFQREQYAFHILRELGVPALHRRYVHLYLNGSHYRRIMEDAQEPNRSLVEQWFDNDSEGDLLKIEDWFEFNDDVSSFSSVDATLQRFTTTGDALKLARYRWAWRKRAVQESANDYTNFLNLVNAVNTAGAGYTAAVERSVDVEEWMRVFSVEHLVGNWDAYGYNRGKNMYTYRPTQGRWALIPWDIDFVLGLGSDGTGTDLFGCNDPTISTMYNTPALVRPFWRALEDAIQGPLQPAIVSRIADAKYRALLANGVQAIDPAPMKQWIADRVAYLNNRLGTVSATFAITSNSGNNFSVANNLLALTGTAPVGVKTIEVNGVAYPPQWTSVTGWTLQIPLGAGANSLTLQGYDLRGNPIVSATDTITVTYTGAPALPQDHLVINEIMYNPAVPDAGFVEIHNTSASFSFDLSNYELRGADFIFPEGTVIGPGGFLVVATDPVAFASAYGSSIPIAGVMRGTLQNNGETLTLIKPGLTPDQDVVIDRVRYDSQPPWPAAADGGGSSLQLIDPTQDHSRVANWGAATADTEPPPPQWTFVSVTGLGSNPSLYVYLNSAGDVYLDDLTLVEGSVPNTGANLLANGSFDTDLSSWTVSDNHAGSSVSTTVKRSGAGSLHLVATSGGTTRASSVWQTVAAGLSPEATYTLSYWYLPSTNGSGLTLRLSYNGIVSSHSIAPPATPGPAGPYTPGVANSLPVAFTFPRLWVNEVQPANAAGLADRMGERDPWLEIFNAGTNSVDLSSCHLANNYTNLTQWPFPSGTTIAAGQHLTVWADGQPAQTLGAELHTSFRLNSATGSVALVWVQSSATNVLDYLDYGYVGNDRSIGSYPEGQAAVRQIFHYPTPGGTNNPASAPVPIVINEWMASNTGTLADPADGEPARYDDWFELFNAGSHTVDLSGYFLTDTLSLWNQWAVPAGTLLGPGAHLLVWADGQNKQNGFNGDLHANFQLSKGGEAIGLFAPDGTAIDTVTFGPQTNNISQGRFPDGVGDTYFMTRPTPRTANTVPAANQPPEIAAITSQEANEGAILAFNAAATDPDGGDTLSFSLDPGAPSGASINPSTGLFTWTPTEAQGPNLYSVTIRVTDNGSPPLSAATTFAVTVNEVNSAPVLPTLANTNVNEGTLLSFSAAASDPDLPAQTLAYSLDPGAPPGATINPVSGGFSWTPTEAQGPGSYSITVRVTDDGLPALSDTRTFTITINEANAAPVLASVVDRTIDEGQLVQVDLSATDADLPAQTLTYSLQGTVPTGLTLTGSQLKWTPTEAQGPSTNTVTVKVTDDGLPALNDTKSFKIVVREVNAAPVLALITDQTVDEGQLLQVDLSATDADLPAQTLTYSLQGTVPTGLTLTGSQLKWTPTEAQGPSTNTITVKVTDDGSPALSDTKSLKIVVREVNVAPVLSSIPDQTVDEGQSVQVDLSAADADLPAQALTYSLQGTVPTGLTLTGSQLKWTPTEAQGPSTNTVTVKVTDDGSPALSDTKSFKIVVREINAAPTLAVVTDQTADEGQLLQVDLSTADADLPAQTLTYSLQGTVPTGLTLTGNQLKWTPTEAQGPGTNTITVKVTDDGSPALSDTKSFKIVVREINAAPVLASITDQTVDEGQSVQVDLSTTDADLPAQTLTYSLQGTVPTGLTLTGSQLKWTPTEAQGPSTNTITVKVTDDGSPALSDTKSFKIVVREINAAPTLAAIADRSAAELQSVTFTLAGSDVDQPAQTLTYTLLAGPTGLTLNGDQLSWTPSEEQGPSTNTVTVKVTDNGTPALSATNSFKVLVTEVNSGPTLSAISDQNLNLGDQLRLTLSAADTDLPTQQLTFSLDGVEPTGMSLVGAELTWTPTEAQCPSTNTITVKVTDSGTPALSATQSFKVVVQKSDFKILELSVTDGQLPTLKWATAQGGRYRVEARVSLNQGTWELREELEATGATLTWSDAIRAASGECYYRVLKVR